MPALSASLAYYDSLRRPYLENASLIQAQRDCFGGHTYRRRDDPDGTHTTQWIAWRRSRSLPAKPVNRSVCLEGRQLRRRTTVAGALPGVVGLRRFRPSGTT